MSVYKQNGRWVAQIYDPNLKRKKHVGSFATKNEANAAFERAKGKFQVSRITLAEWHEKWLTNPDWRESTRQINRERTKKFIEIYGQTKLVDFTRNQARKWVTERPTDHGPLRAMFNAATWEDDEFGQPLIVHNPFSRIVKEKKYKRELEPGWLTEADIQKLERCALEVHGNYGPTFAAMIRFAAETGVRPGELYALRLEDLDPDNGLMTVRRAVDSKNRIETLPKNGKVRKIVMSETAYAAALSAERPEGCEYVFVTANGKRFHNPLMSFWWNPVRHKADRGTMAFYELRHYCATKLLDAGLSDGDVAVQLGHTDGGKLVRQVYGHPTDNQARQRIREAMEREEAKENADEDEA